MLSHTGDRGPKSVSAFETAAFRLLLRGAPGLYPGTPVCAERWPTTYRESEGYLSRVLQVVNT